MRYPAGFLSWPLVAGSILLGCTVNVSGAKVGGVIADKGVNTNVNAKVDTRVNVATDPVEKTDKVEASPVQLVAWIDSELEAVSSLGSGYADFKLGPRPDMTGYEITVRKFGDITGFLDPANVVDEAAAPVVFQAEATAPAFHWDKATPGLYKFKALAHHKSGQTLESPWKEFRIYAPTPGPNSTPTAAAANTPVPSVSLPPAAFPYTQVGQSASYALHIKAGAFPIDGTMTIAVTGVSADDAMVKTSLQLDSSLFGGGNRPTETTATIKKIEPNPYSLALLLRDPGATGAPVTTSTITGGTRAQLATDAGTFDTLEYFLDQKTGSDVTKITLWLDAKTGNMIKEQLDGDKPPELGNSLPIPPGVQLGKSVTTLTLKGAGLTPANVVAAGGGN